MGWKEKVKSWMKRITYWTDIFLKTLWTYLNESLLLSFYLFMQKKDDLPIQTNLKKFKNIVSKNVLYTMKSLHRHKLWYSNHFIFGTLFYDKIIQVWNKSSIRNRLDDFDFVIFFWHIMHRPPGGGWLTSNKVIIYHLYFKTT